MTEKFNSLNDPVLFNTTTISFSFPIYSCKITAYRLVLVRKKSSDPPHKQFQKGKTLDVLRLIPNLNSNTIFNINMQKARSM